RVLDVAAGDDGAVGGLERRADLEVREPRVGVLARAPRGRDEIQFLPPPARPARAETAVALASIAFGPADVPDAPIEAAPAVRLDARPAIVEHQPHRIGPPHAVDDVGDARDLVQTS